MAIELMDSSFFLSTWVNVDIRDGFAEIFLFEGGEQQIGNQGGASELKHKNTSKTGDTCLTV